MKCPACDKPNNKKALVCKVCQTPLPQPEPKIKNPEPTESELVHRYVNRTIKNEMYHGRVDKQKFQGLDHTHTVSKNLWMDKDFYFSVVFQSSDQKMEFLRQLKAPVESDDICQIVNGLKLAEMLGIKLKLETTKAYPTGNLDLLEFVLDNEQIKEV